MPLPLDVNDLSRIDEALWAFAHDVSRHIAPEWHRHVNEVKRSLGPLEAAYSLHLELDDDELSLISQETEA